MAAAAEITTIAPGFIDATEKPETVLSRCVASIERDGFAVIRGLYDAGVVETALRLIRELATSDESRTAEALPNLAQGSPILWNLHFKRFFFVELLFASSLLERILVHFLNDPWYRAIPPDHPNYVLRSYVARTSVGALPLHIDSFFPYQGEGVISMQSSILLEEMDRGNGSTLVLPGSHLAGRYVTQDAVAEAVALEGVPGDVILWDSRLWHGAAANPSGRTRWMVTASLTRWWIKQMFDVPRKLPRAFYDRLDPRQKAVLGFCSRPIEDERESLEMRQGYAWLAEMERRP